MGSPVNVGGHLKAISEGLGVSVEELRGVVAIVTPCPAQ